MFRIDVFTGIFHIEFSGFGSPINRPTLSQIRRDNDEEISEFAIGHEK
jgi:hypothetical protein